MSKAILPTSQISRSAAVIATEVDDEIVMMNAKMEDYFSLNPVGRQIWSALEKPRSVTEICVLLQAQYEVDDNECLADVIDFLAQVHAAGLIRVD